MTNEEKRQYLRDWHRLMMRHHAIVEVDRIPDQQALDAYRDFLAEFMPVLRSLQPKYFYRYRKFDEYELENLRTETAWFSHPDQFDDSLDSALNIDLDSEIESILGPNGDQDLKMRFSVAFVQYFLSRSGFRVNRELIEEAFLKIDEKGFDDGLIDVFGKHLDPKTSAMLLGQTHERLNSICTPQLKETVLEWLNNYQDSNKKARAALYNLCLAEEGDNDAMWGLYSDNCKGFCIRYRIPEDTREGAMVLCNLFPIYYGSKEPICLTDILMNGVFNPNQESVHEGIAQSDYEKLFISTYTKEPEWEFQKEWRVTCGNANLQSFPFADAITLGERIDPDHEQKLLEIAKEKRLNVFKRKLNRSGSKIVLERLL